MYYIGVEQVNKEIRDGERERGEEMKSQSEYPLEDIKIHRCHVKRRTAHEMENRIDLDSNEIFHAHDTTTAHPNTRTQRKRKKGEKQPAYAEHIIASVPSTESHYNSHHRQTVAGCTAEWRNGRRSERISTRKFIINRYE